MHLCLVRHAIAVERGLPGFECDYDRPLTEKGRARMREAAAGLQQLFAPEAVLSSPLVRARQTAEILLDAYGLRGLHLSDALATGNDRALFADVEALGVENVIAVGHEPFMSETLAVALTGERGGLAALFKKGAAALLSFDGAIAPGAARLEWLVQPAVLRAIAAGHADGEDE